MLQPRLTDKQAAEHIHRPNVYAKLSTDVSETDKFSSNGRDLCP